MASRHKNKKINKRRKGLRQIFKLRWHHFVGLTIILIAGVWAIAFFVFQPSGQGVADSSCTVSSILVNSCRPWVGAAVDNYNNDNNADESQFEAAESRQGRQFDIIHTYHSQGHNSLTSTDIYFATRANTMLFANWKPGNAGDSWATIASGSDDNDINEMANSIKSLGSTKIFLTVWHEPENDVSPGGDPNCPNVNYKGDEGSVTDYINMWHHVEAVFAADGVNNVVWVMDYMNYAPWDCLVPDLYPGNSYVDWVVFNAYQPSATATFESTVERFTDLLTSDGIGIGKPWGIVEWGTSGYGTTDETNYIQSAQKALDSNDSTMSKIKMYMAYDSNSQGCYPVSSTCANDRMGYDDSGNASSTKSAAYYAFVDDPRFTDSYYAPPPDTTPPTVSIASPENGTTVSGNLSISGSASDNVGVSSVSLYVNGSEIATDTMSPYNFMLNTTKYADGDLSLQLKASDSAGNVGSSSTVTVTVNNQSSSGSSGSNSGGASSGGSSDTLSTGDTSTTISTNSTSAAVVPVKGTLIIHPVVAGQSVQLSVDGRAVSGDSIDTGKLTNGTHVVTITEDGKTIKQKISVHNAWPTALHNELEAHKTAYTTGSGAIILLAIASAWVFRLTISSWLLRHLRIKRKI